MSRAAASLELPSTLITSLGNPDALVTSLEAVTTLRAAVASCAGLVAREPLSSTISRIIAFVAEAFEEGLPEPTEASDAAWRLASISIACGFELVEINFPDKKFLSTFWTIPLNVLSATLATLKAQLFDT